MKYTRNENSIVIFPSQQYEKKSVRDFLDEYLISRKNRYLLLQNRQILLDGKPVTSDEQLIGSQPITLLIPPEEPDWKPATAPCKVVYEDDFVYIVHKEPGCIIHGVADDDTCLNAMAARYQLDHQILSPVRPLHRLDKDTQGLVLYSKIPFFQPWLDSQLAEKQISRHYLAITRGRCKPHTKAVYKDRIGRDRHKNGVYRISKTGVEAVTRTECLAEKNGYLLFACELETGRTHQIRVHLAGHGFPIVNDPLYGTPSRDFRHMGLWADEITFRSPITRKKHRIHDIKNDDYQLFEGEIKQ